MRFAPLPDDWTAFALAALGLMLTAPFLMAHHYYPLTAFFQEWWAAAFGLAASACLIGRTSNDRLEAPELVALPLGLLLIVALQALFLPTASASRLYLFALYLLWATVLLVLGRQLARRLGLTRLTVWIAAALLPGALAEAATGVLQLYGGVGMPWIFPHLPDNGVRGNLAQNNSFNHYLWLGIAAALYLRAGNHLPRAGAVGSLGVLIVFSLFSGSRSTWLYALGYAALATWAVWRWPEQAEIRRFRNGALAVLAGTFAVQGLFSAGFISELLELVGTSAGSRLLASGGDPMRPALWKAAWLIGREHPWLGSGIGQYTWHFYQHVLDLMPTRLLAVPEHAHNLVLQLWAEAGLPAVLLLAICAWRWAAPLLTGRWQAAHLFCAACLLIAAVHSSLEYPLWYTFFLGPTALLAGAVSTRSFSLRWPAGARTGMAAALAFGAVALMSLGLDYSRLEDAVNGRLPGQDEPARQLRFQAEVAKLAGSPFRPYLDLVDAAGQEDSPVGLAEKQALCDRAIPFSATRLIVFKCAHLQALAGDVEGARISLRRAVAAYPAEAEALLPRWRSRAASEPALAGLVADFPAIVPAAAPR